MDFFRVNFLYGLIALVPLALFGLVAYYLYGFWTLVILPLSDELGLTTNQSRIIAVLLAIPCFFALCIFLGWLIRTRFGALTFDFLESRLLSQIPGYGIVANLLRGFADRQSNYPAALVDLTGQGVSVPGFIMEDDGGDRLTVFVPLAPLMTMGSVYIVVRERVEALEDATIETANTIGQWGIGFQQLARRRLQLPAGSAGPQTTSDA